MVITARGAPNGTTMMHDETDDWTLDAVDPDGCAYADLYDDWAARTQAEREAIIDDDEREAEERRERESEEREKEEDERDHAMRERIATLADELVASLGGAKQKIAKSGSTYIAWRGLTVRVSDHTTPGARGGWDAGSGDHYDRAHVHVIVDDGGGVDTYVVRRDPNARSLYILEPVCDDSAIQAIVAAIVAEREYRQSLQTEPLDDEAD